MSLDSKPLLPPPPDEMKYRRHQLTLRRYQNGSPLLREFSSTSLYGSDQSETPTQLEAFDVIGQEVFGFYPLTIEGNYRVDEYHTLSRTEGLPTLVISRKIGKVYYEIVAEMVGELFPNQGKSKRKPTISDEDFRQLINLGARVIPLNVESQNEFRKFTEKEVLKDSNSPGIGELSLVEIFYDDANRPVKIINSIDLSPYIESKPEDQLLVYEKEEKAFYYNSDGKLKITTRFVLEDGQLTPRNATIFEYEDLNENEVRNFEYSYYSLDHSDLNNGTYSDSIRVRVVNKKTLEESGYAVYEYEDFRTEDILSNYDRIKRYPNRMEFRRITPKPNQGWKNWESQPVGISCPSWLTGADIYSIASGAQLEEVGTPGDLKRKKEVYYLDEFVNRIRNLNDKEALEVVGKLLNGEAGVNMIGIDKQLQRVAPDVIRMSKMQRFSFVAILLQKIAEQIDKGSFNTQQGFDVMRKAVFPLLNLTSDEIKQLSIKYKDQHFDLKDQENLGLWALDNLNEFPFIIGKNRHRFKGLLE